MRKGIMSLEGLEEPVDLPEVTEAEIEIDVAKNDAEAAEIENDADRIEETESIGEAVDTMTEQVEAAVESGEGMSEETARAVDTALEHFKARLGYSKEILPSMESFKSADSRLAQTKVALENLKVLQAGLNKNLAISQEGLGARLKNVIERLATSDKKILSKVQTMKDMPAIESKKIEDPAWGRVFARSGKNELSGADIVKAYADMSSSSDRNKLKEILTKTQSIFTKVGDQLSRSTFIANDDAVKEITKLSEEADKLISEYKEFFDRNFGKEGSVNVTTATTAEVKKLASEVIATLQDDALNKAWVDYETAAYRTYDDYFENGKWRLIGQFAADFRAFRRLIDSHMAKVVDCIHTYRSVENKAAYSAYKYLEASTK